MSRSLFAFIGDFDQRLKVSAAYNADSAGSAAIPHVTNTGYLSEQNHACVCAGFYEVLKLTGLQREVR